MTRDEFLARWGGPLTGAGRLALAQDLDAVLQAEREASGKVLREGAIRLLGGRKRVNQVDTHVADVLGAYAERIEKQRKG